MKYTFPFFILLFLIACSKEPYLYTSNNSNITNTIQYGIDNTPEIINNATEYFQSGLHQSIIDPKYCFTIYYPDGWFALLQDQNERLILRSYDVSQLHKIGGGVPIVFTVIKVDIYDEKTTMTLDEYVKLMKDKFTNEKDQIIEEQYWMLQGITKAWRVTLYLPNDSEGDIYIAEMYTIKGNIAYEIIGFGGLSAFDNIARTFDPGKCK